MVKLSTPTPTLPRPPIAHAGPPVILVDGPMDFVLRTHGHVALQIPVPSPVENIEVKNGHNAFIAELHQVDFNGSFTIQANNGLVEAHPLAPEESLNWDIALGNLLVKIVNTGNVYLEITLD